MIGMQAKPTFGHEIDHNPDDGCFKVYASVLGLDGPTPTFFCLGEVISYAKGFYRFDFPSLVDWLCSAGLSYEYPGFVIGHLTKALSEFVSSPLVHDMSFYMTCTVTEDALLDKSLINPYLPTEDTSLVNFFMAEEDMRQSSSLCSGYECYDWYVDMN